MGCVRYYNGAIRFYVVGNSNQYPKTRTRTRNKIIFAEVLLQFLLYLCVVIWNHWYIKLSPPWLSYCPSPVMQMASPLALNRLISASCNMCFIISLYSFSLHNDSTFPSPPPPPPYFVSHLGNVVAVHYVAPWPYDQTTSIPLWRLSTPPHPHPGVLLEMSWAVLRNHMYHLA